MTAACARIVTPPPVGIASHLAFREYSPECAPFVFLTFARSFGTVQGDGLEHAMKRLLRDPGTTFALVTPRGEPDELMGWAAATPTCLVYAYVRFAYRRGKIGAHVGTALIEAVTGKRDNPVALWTIDASRMAAHGFPIRYDLDEHQRFLSLAR